MSNSVDHLELLSGKSILATGCACIPKHQDDPTPQEYGVFIAYPTKSGDIELLEYHRTFDLPDAFKRHKSLHEFIEDKHSGQPGPQYVPYEKIAPSVMGTTQTVHQSALALDPSELKQKLAEGANNMNLNLATRMLVEVASYSYRGLGKAEDLSDAAEDIAEITQHSQSKSTAQKVRSPFESLKKTAPNPIVEKLKSAATSRIKYAFRILDQYKQGLDNGAPTEDLPFELVKKVSFMFGDNEKNTVRMIYALTAGDGDLLRLTDQVSAQSPEINEASIQKSLTNVGALIGLLSYAVESGIVRPETYGQVLSSADHLQNIRKLINAPKLTSSGYRAPLACTSNQAEQVKQLYQNVTSSGALAELSAWYRDNHKALLNTPIDKATSGSIKKYSSTSLERQAIFSAIMHGLEAPERLEGVFVEDKAELLSGSHDERKPGR